MVTIKTQYPLREDRQVFPDLMKTWAENENGEKFYILQKETGFRYEEAIDRYPCQYTYEPTNIPVEEGEE